MKSLAQILAEVEEKDAGKYVKHEWQLYGYHLAKWMDDLDRVSMYMKLAKTEDRNTLQNAWDFVKDSNPRSRSRLFMWKLGQIRKEKKAKAEMEAHIEKEENSKKPKTSK